MILRNTGVLVVSDFITACKKFTILNIKTTSHP
jgi:hypothetical protein